MDRLFRLVDRRNRQALRVRALERRVRAELDRLARYEKEAWEELGSVVQPTGHWTIGSDKNDDYRGGCWEPHFWPIPERSEDPEAVA